MSDRDLKKPHAALGKRIQLARKSVRLNGRLFTAREVGHSLSPTRSRVEITRWETGWVKPPPLLLQGYLKVLMQHGLPEDDAVAIAEFAYPGARLIVRRSDDASKDLELTPTSFVLSVDYPDDFSELLRKATKLSMTGTNLRRHLKRREDIDSIVSRGGSIQAILVDPKSEARRYSAFQENGDFTSRSVEIFDNRVNDCYGWLCDLKTKKNNKFYERVDIRKIDYPLTYGLDALEFEDGRGVIYIRFYPLMLDENDSDRPIIEIGDKTDWYSFFKLQCKTHFDKAESWNCPKKLLGR